MLDDVLQHERSDTGTFVTLCDLTVAADRRTARLAVAGHPGPILLRPELAELPLRSRGPALGILPNGKWPVDEVSLPDDWSLLLYTDGLVEGRVTGSPERLGTDGLLDLLSPLVADRDLQAIAELLIAQAEELHGGPLPDDVALLLLTRCDPRTT